MKLAGAQGDTNKMNENNIKSKSRGRKITIFLDGEWSEYLTKAVAAANKPMQNILPNKPM